MKKRRSTCLTIFLLFLLSALCVGTLTISWAVLSLPDRAARAFGPPDPALDPLQRIYLSVLLVLQENNLTQPIDPNGTEQPFQVKLGESTNVITLRLEAQGLISNAGAFRDYLVYAGLDTTLQAGEYTLSPKMTAIQIARTLQDATPSEVTFNILPGWRIEEIAAALPTSGLDIQPEVFLQAVSLHPRGYSFSQELPDSATLEGFLMPGSYHLSRQLTADELITILLDNFDKQVGGDLREGFQKQGLSLYQAVTLASIVQREAVVEAEMPKIASVFLNRRAAGMNLDSDPTVQYALGFNAKQNTWWTNPLSAQDLKFYSPYNTYLFAGLPPTPIANPGLQALRAVAYPAQTPYFYFRAACDGTGRHVFAETYEKHVGNACK